MGQVRSVPTRLRWQVRVEAGELAESYVTELRGYGRTHLGPLRALPACDVHFPQLEDLDMMLCRQGLSAKTRAHVRRSPRLPPVAPASPGNCERA